MATCSCCGSWCKKQDPSLDKGFGSCDRCADENEIRNEQEWNALERKVRDSMKPANRDKFMSYDYQVRRGLMLEMMDAGLIQWTISRR